MRKRVDFRCPNCDKVTTRNIGILFPGEWVRCKYCGSKLWKKPEPLKPNKVPEIQEYDLSGQTVQYLTCDRCGARFNKRLARYDRGTVFCPGCAEEYLV